MRFSTLVFLLFLLVAFSADAQSKKAFIVGVGDYDELTDLKKTVGDARGYAEVFENDLGFEVVTLLNPSLLEFDVAFTDFVENMSPGDDVAFIFSGHGWSDGAENFLAPSDAPKVAPEAFIKRSSISLEKQVLEELRRRSPNLLLGIIDACRDNPFDYGTMSPAYKGLSRTPVKDGEIILFSAGVTQRSLDRLSEDDPSPHSVFSRVIIPKLRQSRRPIAFVADETRAEVEALAFSVGHQQRPEMMIGAALSSCLWNACDFKIDGQEIDLYSYMQLAEAVDPIQSEEFCYTETTLFFDRSTMTPRRRDRDFFQRRLQELREDSCKISQVRITAYGDVELAARESIGLSKVRALNVKSLILGHGVPEGYIQLNWFGNQEVFDYPEQSRMVKVETFGYLAEFID